MTEFKAKNLSEKSWILYSNLCDFGMGIKRIKDLNDENQKKSVINTYAKFIPGSEDLRDLISLDLTSCGDFVRMYCDALDVDLDEDLVWPYHWHINL